MAAVADAVSLRQRAIIRKILSLYLELHPALSMVSE